MTIKLYRKKLINVTAVLWQGDILPHLPESTIHDVYQHLDGIVRGTIKTLEGDYVITAGMHYVVGPGHKGEYWPIEREIFEATYDFVECLDVRKS